jgi:hypothetical protein
MSAVVDPDSSSSAQHAAAINKVPKGATIIATGNALTAGARPPSLKPRCHPATSNYLPQNPSTSAIFKKV